MDWANGAFTSAWESASAVENMVSVTTYWVTNVLDTPFTPMMNHKRKLPSMRKSIWDLRLSLGLLWLTPTMTYTEIRVTVEGIDSQRCISSKVQIWRTRSIWTIRSSCFSPCFSPLLYSFAHRYFFGDRPSTNGVGKGVYHLLITVKWRWIFPGRWIRQKLSGTDRSWDLWVRTIT
jgi:hypothetical protein